MDWKKLELEAEWEEQNEELSIAHPEVEEKATELKNV